ncbi:MAG: hypothetical protein VB078_05640 [Clostridiaceae bacterium]|nr:hypothetical protein [Clostridiaceae bacterium]
MSERFKNVTLALMSLLMIILLMVNLTLSLDSTHFVFLKNILGIGVEEETEQGASVTSNAVIFPAKLAIRGQDGLYLASGSAMSEVFSEVSPVVSEAMGSVSKISKIDQYRFLELLGGNNIYLSFTFSVPFSLLQYWWTGEMGFSSDQAALALTVSAVDNKVVLAFFDSQSGKYYLAETAAGYDRFKTICDNAPEANAFFAFEQDGCHMLAPYQPVSASSVYYSSYAVTVPDFSAEGGVSQSLLSAYGINPFLAKVYKTTEGDVVYVEGYIALQLSKNGMAVYTSTGEGYGISLDVPVGLSNKETEGYMIKRIVSVLEGICSASSCQGELSVAEIARTQDGYMVAFERFLGGGFITEPDGYSAVVVVKDGVITDIKLWLNSYSETSQTMLLPDNLVISLLDGEGNLLFVRYSEKDGILSPGIFSYNGGTKSGVE